MEADKGRLWVGLSITKGKARPEPQGGLEWTEPPLLVGPIAGGYPTLLPLCNPLWPWLSLCSLWLLLGSSMFGPGYYRTIVRY